MKRKSDVRIGQRAHEEVCRLFPNEKWTVVARKIGCDKKAIFSWRDGCAPSPIFLARLLHLGGDVEYILTGRRKPNENPPEFLAELEEEYT